jgi:hypothetical protein
MVIEIEYDFLGALVVRPLDRKICGRVTDHLKDFKIYSDGSVYLQTSQEIEDFLEECRIDNETREMVEKGWPQETEIDPWVYGHFLGWDAHTLFE